MHPYSIYFSNLIVFVRNSDHRFTIFEIHAVHHIIPCHSFVSILCLVLFNDLQNMTEVHQERMADESRWRHLEYSRFLFDNVTVYRAS